MTRPVDKVGGLPQRKGPEGAKEKRTTASDAVGKLFNFGKKAMAVMPVTRGDFPPSNRGWTPIQVPKAGKCRINKEMISWQRHKGRAFLDTVSDRIKGLEAHAQRSFEKVTLNGDKEAAHGCYAELMRSVDVIKQNLDAITDEKEVGRTAYAGEQVAALERKIHALFSG